VSHVPVTWDETVVPNGEIRAHVIITRRKGNDWYVGGLNNWTEREVKIDLPRFAHGKYDGRIFKDSVNANRLATDYQYDQLEIDGGEPLTLTMKNGGGFAIQLKGK